MRVEIWSDIICPWCGLGSRRLEKAIQAFEHGDQVEVIRRSFVLQGQAPVAESKPSREYFKLRGMSDAQAKGMTDHIQSLATAEGLVPYHLLDNHVGNTTLAHELATWAEEQGKSAEVWAKLYKAYFGEMRSIFDIPSLVQLASEVGLDEEAAREALTSRRYAEKVQADIREAQSLGSSGVPFIVIDRRVAVSGARSVQELVSALQSAWKDRPTVPVALPAEGEVCGPDGCEVPSQA